MSNNRQSERKQLSYFLKIREQKSRDLIGHLLNLSPQGLNMLSIGPIAPGTRLSVLVELPESLRGQDVLPLQIESRWHKRDINPSYYSIGFQHLELTLLQTRIIQELIARFEFGHEFQSVFG